MAQVIITINSREYAIACEDGQELRILQLSRILDEKAKMVGGAIGQVNESTLLAMVGLLLADELSELRKGGVVEKQEQDFSGIDEVLSEKIKKITFLLKKDLQ